ncbi:MAG: CotH kinase family protein [Clostridia bacterium]|nr:CotH kinase family protein [Clostridia bacterium]
MKKVFYVVEILLMLGIITTISCFAKFNLTWLGVLSSVLIVVLAALNVLYMFNFRKNKNPLSAIFIIAGILFSIIGNIFIIKSPYVFFSLMCVSQICMLLGLLLNSKLSWWDVSYALVVAVPMLLLTNLSPLFGFAGVFNRIIVSLYIMLTSSLLGVAIAHLIKKQTAFNITFSIVSFFNFIYSLGLIILKQSNVTHKINSIVSVVFYVLLFLFALTVLFINKDLKIAKINTKRNVAYSVSICLVSLLIGYTIASNFMAFNFVSAKIYKEHFLKMVENNLNIPIVEIYTQDNEQPKNKTDYVNCSFEISNCENEEYNFAVPMTENYEDEGCVGIRLRGNSTMKARKQPYRIKFDEKQSFFDLKANKSWVLLADYYDQSYIRNYAAFTLAKEFEGMDIKEEQDFVPTPHHVALIINNEFKGLYVLCEQMDEKKGRANVDEDFDVAVDKEFPFLVEMDYFAYQEGKTGVDNFYVESVDNHVEIKFPEAEERGATATSDVVYDYIYEYINAVFTTLKTNEKVEVSFRENPVGLTDLVDLKSAADYYLINEIMLNADSVAKSIYLHKTKDGLMKFGPVWDFDFSTATTFELPYNKSYIEDANKIYIAKYSAIFKYLIQNEDFYNLVASRYNAKNSAIINTYSHLKDYKSVISPVAKIDAKMWHGMTGEFQFDMQYDYARLFLMDRYNFLNTAFAKPHAEFLALI